MTDELKAAALLAAKEISKTIWQGIKRLVYKHEKPEDIIDSTEGSCSIILRHIQPVIDADQKRMEHYEKVIRGFDARSVKKEIERLEAALRGIQKDKCTASGLRSRARKALNGRTPHNVACMEHKIDRYEKALRFYADKNSYDYTFAPKKGDYHDMGDIARTALGEERKDKPTRGIIYGSATYGSCSICLKPFNEHGDCGCKN